MDHDFHACDRFSDRVENYVKSRPGYPPEVLDFAEDVLGVKPEHVVADIGAGTGIFTALLLKRGHRVFAVEPNPAMRAAAGQLQQDSNCTFVSGTAEATTLETASVDLVTAAQAFHWFDLPAVQREFARILRPPRRVLLVWNDRRREGTSFLAAYEDFLLRESTDYRQLAEQTRILTADLPRFFNSGSLKTRTFPTRQEFHFKDFRSRVFSSSYVPGPQHPRYQQVQNEVRVLFDTYAVNGCVVFEYETNVWAGTIPPPASE